MYLPERVVHGRIHRRPRTERSTPYPAAHDRPLRKGRRDHRSVRPPAGKPKGPCQREDGARQKIKTGARRKGLWSSMNCWDEKCKSWARAQSACPASTPDPERAQSTHANAARRKAAQRGMHGRPGKRSRDEHISHEEGGDAALLAQLLRHRTTSLRGTPPQDPCTASNGAKREQRAPLNDQNSHKGSLNDRGCPALPAP